MTDEGFCEGCLVDGLKEGNGSGELVGEELGLLNG